jgi:hypothetical protein
MSIADRVTLRYANALIESDYSTQEAGYMELDFKVKLGDLSSKIPELKQQLRYNDEELDDDTVQDCFTELYFRSEKRLEGEIWKKIKHFEGVSNFLITDIDGLPSKMTDLKNVTLEIKAKVFFELSHSVISELQKNVESHLKAQFY